MKGVMTKPRTKAQKALAAFTRARRDTVLVTEDHRVDKSRAARIQRREEVLRVMSPKSPNRQSKYHNRKVVDMIDGTFDSRAEFKRWGELKLMVRAKEIQDLQRQVPFSLDVQGEHIGDYVADFVYLDRRPGPRQGRHVVEDVKGHRTEMFKWKAKHVRAQYGFSIVEIKA